MKYGETLRQRSIPAWQTHNIDYEDIKHFIKEHTTPGNGKGVSIPGTGDELANDLDDSLYRILEEQNERITWFVRSKVGEIKRRLGHLEQQINKFAARRASTSSRQVSLKRLERYGRIETDIIKIGEEIKSLSRFVGVQQTAFRKLLKKYKKWTGSVDLGERFNYEVLNTDSSFTKTDLQPFVEQYEELLDAVRTLYNEHVNTAGTETSKDLSRTVSDQNQLAASPYSHVQDIVERGKQVEFDHLLATLRIGSSGKNAVYWVHSENLVELQVLLSQHTRSFTSYRKTPLSSSTPPSPSRKTSLAGPQNFFDVIADDQDQYLVERSSQTLEANESRRGSTLQNAALHARCVRDEDAALLARRLPDNAQSDVRAKRLIMKRKCIQPFLERDPLFVPRKAAIPTVAFADAEPNSAGSIQEMRQWLETHDTINPIATIQSQRSRFYDISSNASGVLLASLDSSISIHYGVTLETGIRGSSVFPYSVLRIRQEGTHPSNLVQVLDRSHLLERVHGFSLEYHAVWDVTRPEGISPPSWLSLLQQDLRKIPDITSGHNIPTSDYASQSTTPQLLTSNSSETGNTNDGSTNPAHQSNLDGTITPQRSSMRALREGCQKGRATYNKPSAKYWSEYDHPEDSEDDNAYILYIDPDHESWFDKLWTKTCGFFQTPLIKHHQQQPLLSPTRDLEAGSRDSESSDDEIKPLERRQTSSYGTVAAGPSKTTRLQYVNEGPSWLPTLSLMCFVASIIILVIGFILASTGRRKKAYEVDAGIIIAVVSSLVFAGVGLLALLRHSRIVTTACWILTGVTISAVAIASGILLGWAVA